jgi:hypothetical protein
MFSAMFSSATFLEEMVRSTLKTHGYIVNADALKEVTLFVTGYELFLFNRSTWCDYLIPRMAV